MREAAAADVLLPLRDPRSRANPGIEKLLVLIRVIVRLGMLPAVDARVLGVLYIDDMRYLTALYDRINGIEDVREN